MTAVAIESKATPTDSTASAAPASSAAAAPPSSAAAAMLHSSAAGPPTTYDLKVPDKATVDPAIVERTAAIARAQGLDNAAGQVLLDGMIAEVSAQEKAVAAAWQPGGALWKARDEAWSAQALADPELGGSKEALATSVEYANKVVDRLADPDLKELLKVTGWGSHPAVLRLLNRIGRGMSESSFRPGKGAAGGGPKTAAEKLYGKDGTGKKTPTE